MAPSSGFPPLRVLPDEAAYRTYYERVCCGSPFTDSFGIVVYSRRSKFGHAFFESSKRDKNKDIFSPIRAERIDWIAATLGDPQADHYQGWDGKRKRYDPNFRVSNAFGDFVVVTLVRAPSSDGNRTGEFWTAYVADNSIGKIRKGPQWRP